MNYYITINQDDNFIHRLFHRKHPTYTLSYKDAAHLNNNIILKSVKLDDFISQLTHFIDQVKQKITEDNINLYLKFYQRVGGGICIWEKPHHSINAETARHELDCFRDNLIAILPEWNPSLQRMRP